MANDRIWIRCKRCGEGTLVTKYYPSTDLGQLHDEEKMLAFIRNHLSACAETYTADLEGDTKLEFCTDDPSTASGQIYVGKDEHALWMEEYTSVASNDSAER